MVLDARESTNQDIFLIFMKLSGSKVQLAPLYRNFISSIASQNCLNIVRSTIIGGWPVVLEFLEFLEMFLNCNWFLKNPWNNEFLRICSWNVPEFYFSSFIKTSAHLFHDSSFWNWCLYIGSSYYFMMLRLL